MISQIPPTGLTATMGNTEWRTAARFRRDFWARSLLLPAVSATSQSGKDLTLSILNWWAERIYKEPASDTGLLYRECQGFPVPLPPPPPPPPQQRGAPGRLPPAGARTPTSSLLMGTEGCRRFPISRRFSNRSASSFIRSASHFRMASSMRSRTFLICETFRFCR